MQINVENSVGEFLVELENTDRYWDALSEVEQIILNESCKCSSCIELRSWLKKYKDILDEG